MNSFTQIMRQLGPVRIVTMAIVAAGMIGFFMFMTSRLATPELSLLYSDLSIEDSSTNRDPRRLWTAIDVDAVASSSSISWTIFMTLPRRASIPNLATSSSG